MVYVSWLLLHRDKLQCYRKVKIIDAHKFHFYDWGKINNILKTLKLSGVVSFDMSSTTISAWLCRHFFYSTVEALARILPNLREIDLSNTEGHPTILRVFSRKCPRLEKVTWNNTNQVLSSASIDGGDVREATNLKEMYMDNALLRAGLFHKCGSKVLERISIKNARYYRYTHSGRVPVAQNALIKFIRHAPPSLRWFRSDLTQENIGMLRSERPNIEFVN